MHDIEPYWKWRDKYKAEEDKYSPFYEREYSEFEFSTKVYNYYLHPQWDEIGSPTLFIKILFADYDDGYAIIELIGEWNDILHSDIMFLKRDIIDMLMHNGIYRFVLIGENILNFHADETDYYEEWMEELSDDAGWVALINFQEHVLHEMRQEDIHSFFHINDLLQDIKWRQLAPDKLIELIETLFLRSLE
ncbi:MAG: hypothetical protein ACPG4Z_06770 [Chitinophagales bacterium]